MTELLVLPYRMSSEAEVNEFYSLLSSYPNLEWIADTAATIRAGHRLRTPDALQAATALHSHASGYVTNDPVFERVSDVEILVSERLISE